MNRALIHPLLAALLGAPTVAQEPQSAELPAPVVLQDTANMDAAVVALVAERVAAVKTANAAAAAAEGEALAAARTAAGQAHAELGLAYEANTMWTPAQAAYASAVSLLPESPEWGYRLGVCQISLGDAQAALETFRSVAEELSGTAVVQARLGDTALLLGHLEEAEAAWQAAIDSEAKLTQPMKFPESRVGMAQVRFEQDKLEEAEALLREALSLNPAYGHAHYLLGMVLAEQGRNEEAEFELTRGMNSWPAFPPDPHGPRMAALTAGYGRRMMTVENMMQSGQIPQAMQALQALAQERPEDHFVLNLTARALTLQGRLDEAHQALLASERVNPTAQDTKVEMALNMVNRGAQQQDPAARQALMDQAAQKIVDAINVAPLRGRPWYYRGVIEMQRAAGANPADAEAQQAAGQAQQTAVQYLQRAHQLGCTEPQLYEQLAQVYAQMQRTGEMLKFAKEGTRRAPQNPGSWMFLARAELTVKNFDASLLAQDRAEEVAKLNPQMEAQVKEFGGRLRQAAAQQRAEAEQAAGKSPAPSDK